MAGGAYVYPAAYTGGTPITGCDNVGHIAIGTQSNVNFFPLGNFWGGIKDTYTSFGWIIISDTNTAGVVGRSTGGGTTPPAASNTPTFWGYPANPGPGDKTDKNFLKLVNYLPPTVDGNGFNTPTTTPAGGRPVYDENDPSQAPIAKAWLNANGYWTNYPNL